MHKCTECGKDFLPAPLHMYKTKDGMQCSYTCWNKAKAKLKHSNYKRIAR